MRPEVHAIKQDLQNFTSQVWGYENAHFVSPMLSPTIIERLLTRDNVPATIIPSTEPGELRQRLSMTFEAAEEFAETMRRERGSEARGK